MNRYRVVVDYNLDKNPYSQSVFIVKAKDKETAEAIAKGRIARRKGSAFAWSMELVREKADE